ncbi:MAG: hypothetical protein ACK5AZ_08890 [Bryobacteraceae bacterium]
MSDEKETRGGCGQVRGECFCMGAGPAFTEMLKRLGPESAMSHFRAARLEFLKGVRELIDKRIERLSRREEKKGRTVPVE